MGLDIPDPKWVAFLACFLDFALLSAMLVSILFKYWGPTCQVAPLSKAKVSIDLAQLTLTSMAVKTVPEALKPSP